MEIFGQPTSALPEKKRGSLEFSEVTFLQAQCHLAWRSWCHSCISDESWVGLKRGELWSINFDKKTWVRRVFFQRKTLGSVILVFELRVNFQNELSTHPCHIVSWSCIHGIHIMFVHVCTIHFYAGHTPSFMVHNTNQGHVCVYWKCTWKVCFFSHPCKANRWPWMCKQVSFDWFGSASPPVQLLEFFPNRKES